jgi:hypothetical protein
LLPEEPLSRSDHVCVGNTERSSNHDPLEVITVECVDDPTLINPTAAVGRQVAVLGGFDETLGIDGDHGVADRAIRSQLDGARDRVRAPSEDHIARFQVNLRQWTPARTHEGDVRSSQQIREIDTLVRWPGPDDDSVHRGQTAEFGSLVRRAQTS